MITVLTSGRGGESGLLAARSGMRRVEWPAAAKVCVHIWRSGLREVSDMQVTSISDRSPLPFMFRNNRGKVPSPLVTEGLLCGCSHAALHKTNIVQEDFQELERNMELFGCSLQTDMRKRFIFWRECEVKFAHAQALRRTLFWKTVGESTCELTSHVMQARAVTFSLLGWKFLSWQHELLTVALRFHSTRKIDACVILSYFYSSKMS